MCERKPIEATLLLLAAIVACARLVPRFIHHQYPTASDGALLASLLNATALFITDYMTYLWGGMSEGTDSVEPSEAMQTSLKKVSRLGAKFLRNQLIRVQVQFVGNYFYDTGIYLPKLAILALYFRLFPSTMPWLRRALAGVTAFTIMAMLTTCFLDTFWCGKQVSVNWSLEPDACSTFSSKTVFRVDWGFNIASDVLSESQVVHLHGIPQADQAP